MGKFTIRQLNVVPGIGGFWVNDQMAVQHGAKPDGFFFDGEPISPGFQSIREPSIAYCVMIELDDGQFAYGDCSTVLNLGYGGRPLPLRAEDLPALQKSLSGMFDGQTFDGFKAAAAVLDTLEFEHDRTRPVAYGVSQALLSAAALSEHVTMADVLLSEYELREYGRPQIAGSCGGAWQQNVDKAIARRIDMFPQAAIQTGQQCRELPEFVSWIVARIGKLGSDGYAPDLHFDFHSAIGRLMDHDLERVCDYLEDIVERAGPYQVYFEDPLLASTPQQAVDNMVRLRERIDARGLSCRLICDEWVNSPGAVGMFAEAGAAHAFQIKSPDNGSLTNTINAVQTCQRHGILPYLGGSCNETDISVRATVNVGVALNVWRLFTRPGLGFDEGLMIVTNELNRTLARLDMARVRQ